MNKKSKGNIFGPVWHLMRAYPLTCNKQSFWLQIYWLLLWSAEMFKIIYKFHLHPVTKDTYIINKAIQIFIMKFIILISGIKCRKNSHVNIFLTPLISVKNIWKCNISNYIFLFILNTKFNVLEYNFFMSHRKRRKKCLNYL